MTCKFWDAGWCYHPLSQDGACVGEKECPVLSLFTDTLSLLESTSASVTEVASSESPP